MTGEPDAPPPPKLDPESLVLRGNPMRVTRFRRGVIVAIAAAGSTAIASAAWLALKPVSLGLVRPPDEQAQLAQKPSPDALAGAPRSYGDVPKLGPPLPGDLGRPILEHERQFGEVPDAGVAEARQAALQRAEADRERRAADLQSARQSGVMVELGSSRAQSPAFGTIESPPVQAPVSADKRAGLDPERDPNAQAHKVDFVEKKDGSSDLNPHVLTRPASPYMLTAGSIIAASLLTGLNSDLPGLVTAQVTQNAYDNASGHILLIPQGARLLGKYDSVVAFGQKRALVVWQRIIFPDGSSVRIDNMPASDSAGYAGLSDGVDLHSWQLLKGVAMSSLLGVGTELSIANGASDLADAVRESVQQNGARAGDQLVSRNLNIQPTLKVRPGWPLRVVLSKDLLLEPWRG